MGTRAAFLLVVVCAVACKDRSREEPASAPRAAAPAPEAGPAEPAETRAQPGPIEWIEDDYAAAEERARAAGLPIVVDLWAPWCHTCLAMQQTVLADPSLAELAGRFVWVALDTEQPVNAAALERLPAEVWPTFYVVSPGGDIQARQLGATTLADFRSFLRDGERGHLAAAELPEGSPLARLRAGDRAAAAGRHAAAAAAYAAALEAAPADWPRTPDVLVARISALAKAGEHRACFELGLARLEDAARARSAAAADFAHWAARCAGELEGVDVEPLRARATPVLEEVLAGADAPLSTDDRSEALRILRRLALDAGDAERARAYAERQRALLDRAVAAAGSPLEAMTYGYHRAEVYDFLGEGEAVLPWLRELTAALPGQYDPPHRLAGQLASLERYDEAARAAELALARVPDGPRKGRILRLLGDLHQKRGDRASERAARRALVELHATLPAGRVSAADRAEAKAALEAITSSPSRLP